jgi:predicted Holliday junction resolvase-like endonuclease
MLLFISLGVICALLAGGVFYFYRQSKASELRRQEEFKTLFEMADGQYKTDQLRIQSLLEDLANKNTLMERGSQALENAFAREKQFMSVLNNLNENNEALELSIKFEKSQYEKLFGQKKSSEVRTGKIAEQMAPFLKDYPMEPSTGKFIGDPVDFCHFLEDKIVFVEVKSGESQLSSKQRQIRDLIKAGKVEFIVYRVRGE